MKIAILSCFYPFRGGISQFNACLFQELGKTYDIKAFNFSRQYPDFLFPGKTQFVTPQDEAVPIESEALLDTANPFSWGRTARVIRSWDPDILIVRYWMSYFAPSLGFVASRMKKSCRVIAVVDNAVPHERHFFDAPLTRYFLKRVSGCIAMCSEVESDIKSLNRKAKCAIIPHPLYSHFGQKLPRETAERKLNLKEGCKNILFFGLIREYKGLDILLEAFKDLPEDYQLIIAGEPYGSFEKYQNIIDSCRGKDRIHLFPEYIRDSQVKDYFSAADVTVLPYRSATQSGISAISYHFEVPMIVTNVGGLQETVGEKRTGIVAEKPDPDCIRKEIISYFADDSVREGCVSAIRREKERLSWYNYCKELIEFANKL